MALLDRLPAIPLFMRRAALSTVLRYVGMGLQFCGSILLARVLGVEQYGIYSLIFVWVGMISGWLGLGLGSLAGRELPHHIARGEMGLVRGFLLARSGTVAVTAAIGAGILAIGTGLEWFDPPIAWPLLIGLALVQAFAGIWSSTLGGLQKVVLAQALDILLRQPLFLGTVAIIAFMGIGMNARDMYVTWFVTSVPVMIIIFVVVQRALTAEVGGPWPAAEFRMRTWLGASLPMLAMGFANTMQTNIDILMVGAIGEAADLGRYRTASRAVDLVLYASGITVAVLMPMLSRALGKEDRTEAQSLISQSVMMSCGMGLSVALVLAIGAEYYLALYGADFIPAATAMRILIVAQILGLFCGPVAVTLVASRHERWVLFVNVSSLCVNAVLNLLLIPRYGIEGAAFATFTAVLLVKFGLLFLVFRKTPYDPTLWRALKRWRHR